MYKHAVLHNLAMLSTYFSYLSVFLGQVLYFCAAMLPGLFISLISQLLRNSFKNGSVSAVRFKHFLGSIR